MERNKKVAIIGSNGLPPKYGGFETLVHYLTLNLSSKCDLIVFCSKTPREKRVKEINGARMFYLPFNANGAQSIIYDVVSIIISVFIADSMLILGTSGTFILPLVKLFSRKKIILNFGGLEWKRQKWPWHIRKYLKFNERIGVKYADVVVTDNEVFREYVKKEYGRESELIEYGGDHVRKVSVDVDKSSKYPFLGEHYFVSVSRAQADNNLHMLLEAFSKLPDHRLVLVSNWDKFDYGIALKRKYKGHANLFLLDAIYDPAELDLVRGNAKAYIHSHSFCGTAPSLVEAMNLGLPVIAYGADTNYVTTEQKAHYFMSSEELVDVIGGLGEDALCRNGAAMAEISKRRYNWGVISQKYHSVF